MKEDHGRALSSDATALISQGHPNSAPFSNHTLHGAASLENPLFPSFHAATLHVKTGECGGYLLYLPPLLQPTIPCLFLRPGGAPILSPCQGPSLRLPWELLRGDRFHISRVILGRGGPVARSLPGCRQLIYESGAPSRYVVFPEMI